MSDKNQWCICRSEAEQAGLGTFDQRRAHVPAWCCNPAATGFVCLNCQAGVGAGAWSSVCKTRLLPQGIGHGSYFLLSQIFLSTNPAKCSVCPNRPQFSGSHPSNLGLAEGYKPEKLTRVLKTSMEARGKKNLAATMTHKKRAQNKPKPPSCWTCKDPHSNTIDLVPDPLNTAHWQGVRYSSGTLLHPRASPASGGVGHLLSF